MRSLALVTTRSKVAMSGDRPIVVPGTLAREAARMPKVQLPGGTSALDISVPAPDSVSIRKEAHSVAPIGA